MIKKQKSRKRHPSLVTVIQYKVLSSAGTFYMSILFPIVMALSARIHFYFLQHCYQVADFVTPLNNYYYFFFGSHLGMLPGRSLKLKSKCALSSTTETTRSFGKPNAGWKGCVMKIDLFPEDFATFRFFLLGAECAI